MTTIEARAKLTLTLRVTGVRDDGFHLIDAEMVELELADVLQLQEPAGVGNGELVVDGPFAAGIGDGPDNLVRRALALAGRRADVRLTKRIPHGGGLGGGSADAAAVLRWAGFGDLDAAARIGADVPFCMIGGRARVSGIGEVVEPLPFVPRDVTLVVPPFGASTPAVYRAWDDLVADGRRPSGANELEEAAIAVEPRLSDWRVRIESACGARPVLAGSGSTWWLDGHHPVLSSALSDAVVVATRTVDRR
jgi:4-diphosphocytidyl-2-C-methyl-D-erythritol kinase